MTRRARNHRGTNPTRRSMQTRISRTVKSPGKGPSRTARDGLTIERRRCGSGFSYHGKDGRRIADPRVVKRLASLAVPPAYADVVYAKDRFCAAAGHGSRCRRPLAIPLSSKLGKGARAAEDQTPCPPDRRFAAHPSSSDQRALDTAANSRIRHGHGDRVDRRDRDSRRRVEARPAVGGAGRGHVVEIQRRGERILDHADVQGEGRQAGREGRSRPALGSRHQDAAAAAGPPPVSLSRFRPGQGDPHPRRQCVPLRCGVVQSFAEGLQDAACLRERGRNSGTDRARGEPEPGANAKSSKPSRSPPTIWPTPSPSAAKATFTRRSSTPLNKAS